MAATLEAQQSRIATTIDRTQTLILPGHVHLKARPEYDQGPVEGGFRLPSLAVHFRASAQQESSIQQFLAEQQDPASANYHKWLTPEEYADRFGVSQSDVAKVQSWLESQGFTVTNVARGRRWISFSGTASQARSTFQADIHHYLVGGVRHYATATEPAIPAALGSVVNGIEGLHDFHLQPRLVKSTAKLNSNGENHVGPDDFATIYDVAPLYKAGIDGTGQKIAIVGQTAIRTSDIQAFRSRFNLPTINLTQVLVPGETNPGVLAGDEGEADLDIEWASAVARNANVIYVYSNDVMVSLQHVVDQNLAPVVSMSYGSCEPANFGQMAMLQATARQANAQGITWLTASGDVGAADCEDPNAAVAQSGLAVDAPGVVPEVTSMGGSEFADQNGGYWAGTNSANGGSALSYIPEIAWNDTALDGALTAGGGGTSTFFPQPLWQTGPGVPNDGFRHVPDLSLSSSADHDGFYVYTGGGASYYGGTSVAAPTMAGIVVLLNQYLTSTGAQKQAGVGNINPTLYRLAQSSPSAFHDIVNGDNIVPCAAGSPGCTSGSIGHRAGPGYDQATGLGSPDTYNLIHQWSAQPPRSSAVVASIDSNPVFQVAADANGNRWPFTLTLTEEAGIPTTVTSLKVNDTSYNVVSTFGTASIGANASVSSNRLGFATLPTPTTIVFEIAGVDASGTTWTEQFSVLFNGVQVPLTVGGASNAASGQQRYAPGMIVSVYGTQMGNNAQAASAIPLPFYMAGFEALINGNPAPLYYVSPNQVNIQIPYETSRGSATLTVGNPFINVDYRIQVDDVAPGIFASNGFVTAPFSTAKRGEVTTLFITGEGKVSPSLATGSAPLSGDVTPQPRQPVSLTVGGQTAITKYVGIPPGLVGVTQINYQVPANAPLGVQPVIVTVGTVASPSVNLTVTQ